MKNNSTSILIDRPPTRATTTVYPTREIVWRIAHLVAHLPGCDCWAHVRLSGVEQRSDKCRFPEEDVVRVMYRTLDWPTLNLLFGPRSVASMTPTQLLARLEERVRGIQEACSRMIWADGPELPPLENADGPFDTVATPVKSKAARAAKAAATAGRR